MFWDTSALVKCYLAGEAGHERARNLLLAEKGHQACSLIWPEAVSAVVRRYGKDHGNREALLKIVEEHLGRFTRVAVDSSHLEAAVRLIRRYGLRAADSVHLAAALFLGREIGRRNLRFVTADAEQAAAARSEGLRTIVLAA